MNKDQTKAQLLVQLEQAQQQILELKAAEEKLRANQARLGEIVAGNKQLQDALEAESVRRRVLFDESPDGILVIDPQTASFVEFNQAAHNQLGYSRQEFAKLHIFDVDVQETTEETRTHIDEVIRNGKADFETLQRTKQGDIRNVHVTAQVVEILGQPVYYCTWRDITERKRAEAARRESDDRYHLLFQSMVQGVVFQDGEGHIIQANPAAERILGLSFDQMQGRASVDPRWHAIHEDGSAFPGETHPAMLALKTGQIVRDVVMGVFNPANESYCWININAVPRFRNGDKKPYQVYATFDDITGRKLVEDKLRESDKNYRELINGMNDTVWVIDFDTSILDVNQAAISALGYSREELLGMKISDIDTTLRPEQISELARNMPRDRVQVFETWHTTRAGRQIPVEISSSLVSFMGRTVIMSIARDITERKQADALRRQAQDDLQKERYLLRVLIDNQPDYIFLKDRQSRFLVANQATARLMGADSPEKLIGRTDFDFYPQELAAQYFAIEQKVMQTRENILGYERAQLDQAQNERWLSGTKIALTDERGQVIGLVGIERDLTERRLAEEALRASEEKFSKAFLASPDAIVISDLVTGRYLDVNESFLRETGYERDEIIGFTSLERGVWARPEDRANLVMGLQSQGFVRNLEAQYLRKSGEVRDALVSAEVIELGHGQKHLLAVVRDITERKLAENALVAREQQLKSLIDSQSHFVIRVNMAGRCSYWNAQFEKEFGWIYAATGGIQNANILNSVCQYHHRRMQEVVDDCIAQPGRVFSVEVDKPAQDGGIRTTLWEFMCLTDESSQPTEIQCMGIEITDRKQAEKALRENEERYRALIENAPDGIVLITPEGKFKYASPSVARIFGYTQEDLPQCDAMTLTHPDDLPIVLPALVKLLEQPTEIPVLQYRFRHKNGEWRWIESTFSNLLALTSVEAIIINFRDIHERKLAEEALQRSQSLLTEAQRIGRIGHMEWNAQDQRLTCSDELYEILGLSRETPITQRTIAEMMLPGEVDRLLQVEARAFEQRADTDYEYCLRRQDGSERWLHHIGKMTYTEAGAPTRMLAIIQDVTARKLTEEALLAEQLRLARIADTVPGAIVTFQLLPDGTLRIPYASRAFEDVYGIPLEAVADNIDAISARVSPEHLPGLLNSIRESARSMLPWRNEYEYQHPQNGRVWIEGFSMPLKEADGSILWHGFSTDITERKNAEVVLIESRSRVELALKGANAAMWDWNVKTGEVVFNERWAEMVGYTLQELEPLSIETWVNLCHPDDLKISNELLQKHFAGETEYYECEARMKHKNGTWRWVIDRGKVMEWDVDGNPVRMFGTHLDITERKREERYTEARLRLANLSYQEIDMDFLLRTMLDEAEFITDSNIGFFHFVDDDQNAISLQAWSTNTVNNMCFAEGKGQHYPVTQAGVWADSIRDGQPRIYNNYLELPGRRELPEGHAPVLRILSLPIKRNNRIVAAMGVGNKSQDYDAHDLEFVKRLAEDAFDIILRKRAELQLRESEERFRTVADFTYDMEYWLDENQQFLYLSPSCKRMTGYGRDDFLRDPSLLQKLIHPADLEEYEQHMEYEFNNPEPVSLDFRIITANGDERWVNHTCQGVSGADGQPRGRRASNRDITARKHSENQVRRQMDDLALVNALNDAANRGESLEKITEFLSAEFRRVFNCKNVGLYLFAPDQKSLDLHFISIPDAHRMKIEKLIGLAIPKVTLQIEPTSYFNRVIDSERGLVTSDRQVLEQWMTEFVATPFLPEGVRLMIKAMIPQVFDLLAIRSIITIPLKSASRTLGALEISSGSLFSEQDLDRLQNVRASFTEILRRKQIEQELMASEEKYRGLLESLDSVVVVVDGNGVILYVNDVAAQQFGGKPVDLIDQSIFSAFPVANATPEMERIHQVFREDRLIVQEVQFFIQGRTRWYRVSYQPIHNEDGRVAQVLINATDIDNIKTIQQELQELNRTLEERVKERTAQVQDLYDNAPVGYHSINDERRFIAINQTELNMLGYKREELIGQFNSVAFSPESAQTLADSFKLLLTEGKIVDMEVMARRKDGTVFPVMINAVATHDDKGRFVSSRSTMTDITLRKLAENELKRNVNFTNALLDAIPTPVFYKDRDGSYLGCNRAFTEIMGKTPEQVRGQTVHQLWPTDRAELYHQKDLELMQMQERQVYESSVIDKNGNHCPVLFVKDIFRDEAGVVAGLVGAFIDIAEHKHAEEALRHANVELARAMRMKDEFLANMSHELRTPLNGMLGLSEALQLQTYGGLSDKQLRAVKNIESSGRHLLSLINDILDLSKIEAGKLEIHIEPISVVDICQASLAFIKEPALKKGISTSFEPDPLAVTVLADVRRLKQILVNLLSNAVKFTPPGGKVTLKIQGNLQKRMLEMSVTDTGIGISADDLVILFQPFTQIDSSLTRKHEGTGLGLALVKELSEMHGGSIHVSSNVGTGSTFTVSIPWQPDSLVLDALSARDDVEVFHPTVEQVAPKRQEKILLAEDVELNIITVGDYLESQGYTLIYALNGREAVEKVREQAPDLVLMDVQMPEMDGLEATRQLRADPRFAAVPIIALTAMAMTGDRERCIEAGATDYISKPLVLRDLLAMIRRLLGEKPVG